MTEGREPIPITRELHDAFCNAIDCYQNWGRSQREPEVSLNLRFVTISSMCELMLGVKDPMPENLRSILAQLSRSSDPPDHSYASGAQYLAHLIRERQEHFR